MKEIIRTSDLSKYYESVTAVNKLSLHVRKGEIYGFLGLNGAGKTTTIRMLLGMIKPSTGFATLLNYKIGDNRNFDWNKIGYLVETPYAYPELTVSENLRIIQKLRLIKNKNSIDRVIKLLNIEHYRDRKAKNLSLGNAQRLGLAKALIHKPEILILDEPANGLDPEGIVEIRKLLIDLARNKEVTVFISSHILAEVSKFADRIGIIHKGELIAEKKLKDIQKERIKKLHVQSKNKSGLIKFLNENSFKFDFLDNDIITISDNDAVQNPDKIVELLVNNNILPNLLKVEEEDLESYFLRTIHTNKGGNG